MAELKIKKSTAGSAPTTLEERTLGIHGDNLYFGGSSNTAIRLAKYTDLPTDYVSTTKTSTQKIVSGINIADKASIDTNGYVKGTWLSSTANIHTAAAATEICVLQNKWIYTRTSSELLTDIGAAEKNHNHDSTYLKLAGGTLTGPVTFDGTQASVFNIHPIAPNGLPLGVVDIENITASDGGSTEGGGSVDFTGTVTIDQVEGLEDRLTTIEQSVKTYTYNTTDKILTIS